MINNLNDGIHGMVPREKMSKGAKRMRDFYDMKPDAPIYQTEFGFYSLERWKMRGTSMTIPIYQISSDLMSGVLSV